METFKTYEELIEAKSEDISVCWKVLQLFLYFLSVICGYGSAILFYIWWDDIFAGNCPLWAYISMPMQSRIMPEEVPVEDAIVVPSVPNWRQKITVTFRYAKRCNFFHFVSLSSCVFGLVWMTLFTMCGKGGYDTKLYVTPWNIVPPAIIFHIIFTICAIFAVHDLEYGYDSFIDNLQKITQTINDTQIITLKTRCDLIKSYLEIFGKSGYDACQTYSALRVLSWIMAWSWSIALGALIFRVITVRDFNLLTVTIYKIPKEQTGDSTNDGAAIDNDKTA